MLNIPLRPITQWPGTENKDPKWSPFRVGYKQTLELLAKELEKLHYVESSLVLEVWMRPQGIRQDQQMRANTKPFKPGVILKLVRKFNGKYDPALGHWVYQTQQLSYPCDAFTDWQDNVRAIALSLEALRKVERYGVFKYDDIVSRLALPSADGSVGTREAAAQFLSKHTGMDERSIMADQEIATKAYRQAAMKLHPDQGGQPEEFHKLTEVRKILLATA